jgi:uncharacterized protein (DUF1778 family)
VDMIRPPQKTHLTFRLEPEDRRLLERVAKLADRRLSALVRSIVREWCAKQEKRT